MEVKKITSEAFVPYGHVIEYPGKESQPAEDNLFRIVVRDEEARGWRIAYLVVRDKSIDKLERHPGSYESFEPVCGKSVLFVAPPDDPARRECFLLDRPVVLNKGVWHGVVTLDHEAEIKIFENADVDCEYMPLQERLHCGDMSTDIITDHL